MELRDHIYLQVFHLLVLILKVPQLLDSEISALLTIVLHEVVHGSVLFVDSSLGGFLLSSSFLLASHLV
jgi:hypothetical protein